MKRPENNWISDIIYNNTLITPLNEYTENEKRDVQLLSDYAVSDIIHNM